MLAEMSPELSRLYADTGRPSITPKRLLMEQLDYNLLFRWFVGMNMDDRVWDATVFTQEPGPINCAEFLPASRGAGSGLRVG